MTKEFEAMGFSVLDLSQFGKGVPDILIGSKGYSVVGTDEELKKFLDSKKIKYFEGINLLVEIKSEKGRLSTDQKKFFSWWKGFRVMLRKVEELCIKKLPF